VSSATFSGREIFAEKIRCAFLCKIYAHAWHCAEWPRSGSRPMKCERSLDGLPGKSLGVGIVFSPPMVRQIHLPRIRIAMIVRAAFYVFQYFERIWGPTRSIFVYSRGW
jgi:hypothetical protein